MQTPKDHIDNTSQTIQTVIDGLNKRLELENIYLRGQLKRWKGISLFFTLVGFASTIYAITHGLFPAIASCFR